MNGNAKWFHMLNEHVISMPDKWEYPWYAAWDLEGGKMSGFQKSAVNTT